jgi:hypothetical protein
MNGTIGKMRKMPQASFWPPLRVPAAGEVDPAEHDSHRVNEADEDFEKLFHGCRGA